MPSREKCLFSQSKKYHWFVYCDFQPMRKLLYIVLSFLLLASCAGQRRHNTALRRAQAILNDAPDSALTLLDSMEAFSSEFSRGTLMRWQLLRAQAQNKLYIPFTTDSVMKEVANYYDGHGTSNERMAAHYLLGSVYRDMGEAPAALHAFQRAMECADTMSASCDYRLLAKVYAQTGLIFNRLYLPSEALQCFSTAACHAMRAKDTLLALNFLQQAIISHYEMGHRGKVVILSDSIHRLYMDRGKTADAAHTLSTAILTVLQDGDTARAYRYLQFVEDNVNEEQFLNDKGWAVFHAYKGKYALLKGRKAEAEIWFRRLMEEDEGNPGLRVFAYKGLRDVYRERHLPDSMMKYAGLYCDANDSSNVFTHREVVERLQSQYQYERWRQESLRNEEKVHKRNRLISALFFCLLGLCGFAYGWYQWHEERNKRKLMEQVIRYQTLKETLRMAKEDLRKMSVEKKGKETLLREKEETISILRQQVEAYDAIPYEVSQDTSNALQSITDKLHQMASRAEKASVLQLQNLRKAFYAAEPLWKMKTDDNSYKMNVREENICILIRLCFSSSEISVLLGLSPQALSNQKKRLLSHLFHIEGKASDLNDMIAKL